MGRCIKELERIYGVRDGSAGQAEPKVSDGNVTSQSDIADMIGKKAWGKGIKITIADDNALSVDCNVNIGYGQSVVSVAKAVQDAVTGALESSTGVKVSAVNINVCGIIRQ